MKEMVKLAAKLYKCQEAAKSLFKDEYYKMLKWYVEELQGIMQKESLDELKAAMFACQLQSVGGNGLADLMFMAAAVEMVETPDLEKLLNESVKPASC